MSQPTFFTLAVALALTAAWPGARAQQDIPPVDPPDQFQEYNPVDGSPADPEAARLLEEQRLRALQELANPVLPDPTLPPGAAPVTQPAPAAAPAVPSPVPALPALPSTNQLRSIPTRLRGGAQPPGPAAPAGAAPAVPAVPGLPPPVAAAAAAGAGATNALAGAAAGAAAPDLRNVAEDTPIPALRLENMPLEQALDIYAALVGRTLLRPPQLAGGPITLKFQTEMTRDEAIEAFNGVFSLNNIAVLPVGQKFLKVVVSAQAVQEGAKASEDKPADLSELGQFTTKIIRTTKVKPGDIAQAVQQFASGKVQNPLLAFDDQNFFVLRDYAANVKRMAEIIEELDVIPDVDYKFEVIPIRYGRVEDIYNSLSGIIGGGGGFGTTARATGATGTLRTGTGTAAGGAGGVAGQFGQGITPQQTAARTTGLTSPGAARTGFANRLQQVTAAAMGGQGQILTDARIIPDERSNSLLVYASRRDYAIITNLVARVDTLLSQVLIESIILQVSLDDNQSVGFSMIGKGQSGDVAHGGGNVNTPLQNLTSNLFGLFPSGFSYFGNINDEIAFALKAIATDGRADVLSRPRIQTSHGIPATFEIGKTVPYITSSTTLSGGVGGIVPFSQYQEKRVVTRLNVTPYITPDGLVVMDIEQAIDQISGTTTIDGNEVPLIDTRYAQATVSVKDTEAVILGGFIENTKRTSKSGVPYLKDIPGLGFFFRSKSDAGSRTEIIVLIRPTVLPTPADAAALVAREKERLPTATTAEEDFMRDELRRMDQRNRRQQRSTTGKGGWLF